MGPSERMGGVMSRAKGKRFLVVRYDVTGWPTNEVDSLGLEAIVQGECNKDEPEHWHRSSENVTAHVEDSTGRKVRDV